MSCHYTAIKATDDSSYGQLMLDAYSTLRIKRCNSNARLFDIKTELQHRTGMLSGGSILYLLIPGRQLDPTVF